MKLENILKILTCVIISYIFANMLLSAKISGDRVLASGQTFEASNEEIQKHDKNWFYDSENDLHRILTEDAKKCMGRWNEEVDFSYICLDVEALNKESADWFINTYDKKGRFLEQQVVTVQNGENWIALNTVTPFRRYDIAILGNAGLEFRIKSAILYEALPQKKKVYIYTAAITLVLLLLCFWVDKKRLMEVRNRKILVWIHKFLEYCYILIGNSEKLNIGNKWKQKKRNAIRILLFFIIFAVFSLDICKTGEVMRYQGLVVTVALFLIAVISKTEKLWLKKCEYSKIKWWYTFCIILCISDFIVVKEVRSIGWFMLFVLGFFSFVWNQMRWQDEIVENMLYALEILAVVGTVYTLVFREKYDGLLYNGYMNNAADFGAVAAFLCMVFGLELCYRIKRNEYGKQMLFYICGVGVLGTQVLLSGKLASIVFMAGVVGVVLWIAVKGMLSMDKQNRYRIVCYGIAGVFLTFVYYGGVKHLPEMLNTAVVYEKEVFETVKDPAIIEILAADGDSVYENVKYVSAENTFQIWKANIREWNIYGHKQSDLRIWNKNYEVNNQLLQMIYRYGMFIIIPYFGVFFCLGRQLLQKIKEKKNNLGKLDCLMLGSFIFWCIPGSFVAIEYPFYHPAWIVMYVLLGRYLFCVNKKVDKDIV